MYIRILIPQADSCGNVSPHCGGSHICDILHPGSRDILHTGSRDILHTGSRDILHPGSRDILHPGSRDILHHGSLTLRPRNTWTISSGVSYLLTFDSSCIFTCPTCVFIIMEEEGGAVFFNDALNTFYLWLCDVRHMVKGPRR